MVVPGCASREPITSPQLSELGVDAPFDVGTMLGAVAEWHHFTFTTHFVAGEHSMTRTTRWDVETTSNDGVVLIERVSNDAGELSSRWTRRELSWAEFQLGPAIAGDDQLERRRVTFEHQGEPHEGWRYDWPSRDPSIDQYTAWFSDSQPGPPLRLDAHNRDVLAKQVKLDAHVAPTSLPLPYTSEQIRRDMPVGTRIQLRTTSPTDTSLEDWFVVTSDRDTVTIRYSVPGSDSEAFEGSSTWDALRDEARFYDIASERRRETFVTSMGSFDGWRYTVPGTTPDGQATVRTFWFADRPAGPPMVMTEVVDGRTVQRREQLVRDPS